MGHDPVEKIASRLFRFELRSAFEKAGEAVAESDEAAGTAGELSAVLVEDGRDMGEAVGEAQRQVEIETAVGANLVALADMGPPRRLGPRDLLAVDQRANGLGARWIAAHPARQTQAAVPADLAGREINILRWSPWSEQRRADYPATVGEADFHPSRRLQGGRSKREDKSVASVALPLAGQFGVKTVRAADAGRKTIKQQFDDEPAARIRRIAHKAGDLPVADHHGLRKQRGAILPGPVRHRAALRGNAANHCAARDAALASHKRGSSARSPSSSVSLPNE